MVTSGALVPYVGGKLSDRKIESEGISEPVAWAGDLIAARIRSDDDFVRVFGRDGSVRFELGKGVEAFDPDGFCFIHGITGTKRHIVVIDSNCRKFGVWSSEARSSPGSRRTIWGWTIPGCRPPISRTRTR